MPWRSINWRYHEMEVIFEEGDERTQGHLGGEREPEGTRIHAGRGEEFTMMDRIGLKAQASTVVTTFWREGENDGREGKYINAFFHYYYLVLEGLHGNRKTKNYQVEEAMTGSATLRAHVEKFPSRRGNTCG